MKNLDTNHFTCDCNIEENNCGIESSMLRAQFRFGTAISATFLVRVKMIWKWRMVLYL